MLWTSFTPARDWFVFDDTGATVAKKFKTRALAVSWVWRKMVVGDV